MAMLFISTTLLILSDACYCSQGNCKTCPRTSYYGPDNSEASTASEAAGGDAVMMCALAYECCPTDAPNNPEGGCSSCCCYAGSGSDCVKRTTAAGANVAQCYNAQSSTSCTYWPDPESPWHGLGCTCSSGPAQAKPKNTATSQPASQPAR